ncbi:EamA family transporter [Algicola sagamiensis]|uniref:EamA family transporter n=1 Tax=Algicola sagamiensis TaxID=163869 RepID=UPI0003A6CDED|nr:EamA family transporter [Algicola sagamiensis]
MRYLWFTTFIWAFSFSLIEVYLAGKVDPYISVLSRMVLAFLILMPFWRPRQILFSLGVKLAGIGAVQLGLMYLFFYHSFLHLSAKEVLMYTILTPFYISLFDGIGQKQWPSAISWLAIGLAILAAAVIRYQPVHDDYWVGVVLVQLANMSFAFGQVAYKRLRLPDSVSHLQVFSYFFLGALCISLFATICFANWEKLPQNHFQWGVLLWLGIVASGVGYLCWNLGCRRTSTSNIAVMNNVLIPAGIIVNVVLWHKDAQWQSLILGSGLLMLSLYFSFLAQKKQATQA